MIVSPDTAGGGGNEKWFDPENIQILMKVSEKNGCLDAFTVHLSLTLHAKISLQLKYQTY